MWYKEPTHISYYKVKTTESCCHWYTVTGSKPFPSCSVLPLFQNESFHMEMSLICTAMNVQEKLISTWRLRTKTRLETDVRATWKRITVLVFPNGYFICGERYEDMIDHRNYTHNLSSCESKAWKKIRPERDSNQWLHRYRSGHGFESRSGLIFFFQPLISQLLNSFV